MIVIKLGGAALKTTLENPELFRVLARIREEVVIVHGGGPEINALSERLGLKPQFVEGLRVTTPETLEVVEMVLNGKINPKIVRGLIKAGRNAFGLSGIDSGMLSCVPEDHRLGKVGKVQNVKPAILMTLLKEGVIPVVASLGLFEDGTSCNVNADLAAASIATALKAKRLFFLTDKDGILDSDNSVILELSPEKLRELSTGETITGGMRVKARAMLEYCDASPDGRVMVMNGLDPLRLLQVLEQGDSSGTVLKAVKT